MPIKISSRFAAFILGFATLAAHAEVKNFRFVGTVTESGPLSPADEKITGSFSYDTSDLPVFSFGDDSGPGYSFANYQIQRPLQAAFNGHRVECESFTVSIGKNFGGNVEDSVRISCQPMVLDGTTLPAGVFGISLFTGPGRKNVLPNIALPSTLEVSRFDSKFGEVIPDSSTDTSGASHFVLDQIDAVQEEPSLLKAKGRIAQPRKYAP